MAHNYYGRHLPLTHQYGARKREGGREVELQQGSVLGKNRCLAYFISDKDNICCLGWIGRL